MIKSRIHQIAQKWRRSFPEKGGFVIIYQGEAVGWTSDLKAPHKWLPGAEAVSDYLNAPIYLATGGDDYNGAAQWSPIAERIQS